MKITNKMNLPQAMVDLCTTEKHNKENTYSATTLLKGAKQILLTERHWDEMEEDVSDRIWAIFGTSVHSMLEREDPNTLTEFELETEFNGMTVTGRVDCYNIPEETVYDYKTASIWKVQYNDFSDWRDQGLTYAWLLKKSGKEVKKCRFVAMLKDWSKGKANDPSYPQSPVYVYEFDVTEEGLKEIEEKIKNKLDLLSQYKDLSDDEIPECSDEEKWAKPTTWAAMKEGRKTALKVFDNKEECETFAQEKGGYVEERKGSCPNCDSYCPCRAFCHRG